MSETMGMDMKEIELDDRSAELRDLLKWIDTAGSTNVVGLTMEIKRRLLSIENARAEHRKQRSGPHAAICWHEVDQGARKFCGLTETAHHEGIGHEFLAVEVWDELQKLRHRETVAQERRLAEALHERERSGGTYPPTKELDT